MGDIERYEAKQRPITPRPGYGLAQEYDALADEFLKVEENRDRLAEQLRGAVSTLKRIAGNEPDAGLLARAELRRLGVPFADPATNRGQ